MRKPQIPTWFVIPFLWIFSFGGVGLAAWTDLSRPAWLEHDPSLKWSMNNISDAQRRALMWILVFFLLTLATWRGLPYGTKWVEDEQGRVFKKLRWLQILWPLKILTVLFHEMCHAIVGTITGGKVKYIGVNALEGGVTGFSNKKRYNLPWTLSAGYIGSCAMGCVLIFAGFDTFVSKIMAFILCAWIVFCIVCCAAIQPKLFLNHAWYRCQMHTAKVTGQSDKADAHRLKSEQDEDGRDFKDKMVSLDIIIFVTLVFLVAIIIAWYLCDSIFLRYIILFMGVGSSTYAIWDIVTDGVITHKSDKSLQVEEEDGSDCAAMAKHHNKIHPSQPRTKLYYALWWFSIQIFLAAMTIILGLVALRDSTVEQALKSRTFISTPHHYHPADLISSSGASMSKWNDNWTDGAEPGI